ncbi:uncharacterized protein LOC117178478 [Belonocnema kinseyi]|uniref:uncharacterized protein LOC117178478 n=1 Tax=Belonocnema kinseyi TaxID=2817044 RepID=UPI00143D98FA|nr:uncharacterized protein LOC117178478 [Belonocnema kinseyi]
MKVLVKAEDISNLEKINTVCFTTISAANVCNEIDDELDVKLSTVFSGESKQSLHQVTTIKRDLIVSIRITVIEYVIPLAKVLEMAIESAENLIKLLKTVIKLQVVKDQTLCVAALDSNISGTASHPRLYLNAARKLAKALENEDKLKLFYTHIEELFLYSMKENCLPEKLRMKVISMWLEKSEREKDFELFVKECLEQGYGELKIVKLLMHIAHENCIGNLTNVVSAYGTLLRFRKVIPEDVVEFVWKTLSEDLEKKIALTNICIRTLACLIARQIKFNLKSETVADLTFKDLETLLLNLRENHCFTIFGVEFIKFLMACEVKNPVISLRRLENDSDLLNIYNVYFLIHSVHAEKLPGEEDQTYQCLSTMLNYCCAQNLDMGIFLMCSATPLLIELAITGFPMCKKISYYFLDFATIWLGYLKDYRARIKVQTESLPEESVKLLVQFLPFVLQLNDADNFSVNNFLREISSYTKA